MPVKNAVNTPLQLNADPVKIFGRKRENDIEAQLNFSHIWEEEVPKAALSIRVMYKIQQFLRTLYTGLFFYFFPFFFLAVPFYTLMLGDEIKNYLNP